MWAFLVRFAVAECLFLTTAGLLAVYLSTKDHEKGL